MSAADTAYFSIDDGRKFAGEVKLTSYSQAAQDRAP